jgi:hypothetical protein
MLQQIAPYLIVAGCAYLFVRELARFFAPTPAATVPSNAEAREALNTIKVRLIATGMPLDAVSQLLEGVAVHLEE